VESAPVTEAVFLLPSKFAPERFQDSKRLRPDSTLLREKQSLGTRFLAEHSKQTLPGFWFYKTMSSGIRHLHVYVPAYDQFLAGTPNDRSRHSIFDEYADRYEQIRRDQPPRARRTEMMNTLVSELLARLPGTKVDFDDIRSMYAGGREGYRLVALACFIEWTHPSLIHVVTDTVRAPRSPFELWTALRAASKMVGQLEPMSTEPCVAALLAAMDDEKSLINNRNDDARRKLSESILEVFAAAIGITPGRTMRQLLRQWFDAEKLPSTKDRPCIVIFGSDSTGVHRSLCTTLGKRLAMSGWRLNAGYGENVGSRVIAGFAAIDPEAVTGFTTVGMPKEDETETAGYTNVQELRQEMISGADCAIVIRGGRGTRIECELAMNTGRPVLAVGATGGTAREIRDISQPYLEKLGVPAEILGLLNVEGKAEIQAERIVRVANIVRQTQLRQSPPPRTLTPGEWTPAGELRGHSGVILRITWHPGGQHIATGSVDETSRIWDIASGKEIACLRGHYAGVNQVVWSPDTTRLATCSFDRSVRIWSARDWKLIRVLEGHSNDVRDVAWSPDGRLLASASADRTIALWDAETGELKATASRRRGGTPLRVSWLEGTRSLIVFWEDGKACLYSSESLAAGAVRDILGQKEKLIDAAYSPDRRLLAVCSERGTIKVWSWPRVEVVKELKVGSQIVRSVGFSADGRFLAANSYGRRGIVRIWETVGWRETENIAEPTSDFWPCNIAWAPRGHQLATLGVHDFAVRLWNMYL
jgi:WD40 repeat protein